MRNDRERTFIDEQDNLSEKTRDEFRVVVTDGITFINALENPTDVENRLKGSLQLLYDGALNEQYPLEGDAWILRFGTTFFIKIITKIRHLADYDCRKEVKDTVENIWSHIKEIIKTNLQIDCIDKTDISLDATLHQGMGKVKGPSVNFGRPTVVTIVEPGWQGTRGVIERAKVLTARPYKKSLRTRRKAGSGAF